MNIRCGKTVSVAAVHIFRFVGVSLYGLNIVKNHINILKEMETNETE